jgi:hypothetical protein
MIRVFNTNKVIVASIIIFACASALLAQYTIPMKTYFESNGPFPTASILEPVFADADTVTPNVTSTATLIWSNQPITGNVTLYFISSGRVSSSSGGTAQVNAYYNDAGGTCSETSTLLFQFNTPNSTYTNDQETATFPIANLNLLTVCVFARAVFDRTFGTTDSIATITPEQVYVVKAP